MPSAVEANSRGTINYQPKSTCVCYRLASNNSSFCVLTNKSFWLVNCCTREPVWCTKHLTAAEGVLLERDYLLSSPALSAKRYVNLSSGSGPAQCELLLWPPEFIWLFVVRLGLNLRVCLCYSQYPLQHCKETKSDKESFWSGF